MSKDVFRKMLLGNDRAYDYDSYFRIFKGKEVEVIKFFPQGEAFIECEGKKYRVKAGLLKKKKKEELE